MIWPGLQRRLGNAVAGLDDRRLLRRLGGAGVGGALEEAADRDGVGGVVGALVDDLQRVVGADDRGRDLDAAGAPAAGQRHFARAERHLVARNGDGLEQSAADHPLRLLVEIGVVVSRLCIIGWRMVCMGGHSAASGRSSSLIARRRSSRSRRMRRISSSSPWKST